MAAKFWLIILAVIVVAGIGVIMLLSDGEVQYEIIVDNETNENILVKYTCPHCEDTSPQTVIVPAGTSHPVLYTESFDPGEAFDGSRQAHCKLAVSEMAFFLQDTLPGTIGLCDEQVRFGKEDIGQWRFEVKLARDDFPR